MRIIIVALSSFAVLAPVALLAHEGHKHRVMGVVAAVDAGHVEIETKDAKKVSVLINKETKCLRGQKPASTTEIRIGERIVVTVVEKGGKQTAREILLAPTDKEPASLRPGGSWRVCGHEFWPGLLEGVGSADWEETLPAHPDFPGKRRGRARGSSSV